MNNQNMLKKFGILLVIISAYFSLKIINGIYIADVHFEKSQNLLKDKEYESALFYANSAVQKNPLEPNYYRGRAKVYITSLVAVPEGKVFAYKVLALTDLKKAYNLNPNNLVTVRNSIPLYYFLAAKNLSEPAGPDNIDSNFLPITNGFYQKIKNRFPNDVGFYTLLAKYQKRLNLIDGYSESADNIDELRPDLFDWYEGLKLKGT